MSRAFNRPSLARRLAIPLVVLAVAAFYFLFNPLESPFMPQCVFHKVTGLSCPGCGSQRVVHHLLHGDLVSAFQANALMVCLIPGVAFLVWLETQRTRRPRLYTRVYSVAFIYVTGAIFAIWFVARNILKI